MIFSTKRTGNSSVRSQEVKSLGSVFGFTRSSMLSGSAQAAKPFFAIVETIRECLGSDQSLAG